MTHEEMMEEAAKREEENILVGKISDEDYQKILNLAKEKKVLEIAKNFIEEHSEAMKELAAIEAKELIDEALEELNAIVMGGQDTREFYNSVKFIKDVLNRLR